MKQQEKRNKQIRKTRYDVLTAQKRIRTIIKQKKQTGTLLTKKELEEWETLCADSLMSWGKNTKAYLDLPSETIYLGSVHTFALKMMDQTNPAQIKNHTIQLKTLWNLLYDYILEVFPCSLDEALHISKESHEYESGSAIFSSDSNITDYYENNNKS